MGDAADRRAGEYARLEERLTQAQEDFAQALRDIRSVKAPLEQRIAELEKKLVERDVYEAEQRLPPEQAALIKHLKTVERCIDEASVADNDGAAYCIFCDAYMYPGSIFSAHDKACAWLALQFDRKPATTMTMVHEHALNEHETWKRRQKPASTATGIREWLANAPPPAVYRQPTIEELRRARLAVEESRERLMAQPYQGFNGLNVVTHPLVPPGAVYVMPEYSARDPGVSARQQWFVDEAHLIATMTDEQLEQVVHGEWPDMPQTDAPVAPPNDEDVP